MFRSWLPETDLQQDPAVVATRTVLCSLLPKHGWPWKAICVLCEFVCAEHINCTHCSERACASLHPGFHSEQSTLNEFCCYLARNVLMNIDYAAEARTKPIKPEGSEDLHSENSHSDNEVKPEVDCENVGGLEDNEMEQDFCTDDGCQFICHHPWQNADEIVHLALQTKVLESMERPGRKSRHEQLVKDMADAYGKEFLATKPLAFELCSSTCMQQFGLQFRQESSKMITSQNSFIALQKRKLMDDDETSEMLLSEEQIINTKHDQNCTLVPADLKAQGPAAVALDLLVRKKANEEQCDATALIVEPLQRRFEQRENKDTFLCPNGLPFNNQVFVAIGGGGCGKSFWLMEIVKPLIQTFFGPSSWAAQAPSNQAARLIEGRTLHNAAALNATSSLKTRHLVLKGNERKKMELRMENVACWAADESGQCSGALLHASALRCTYARMRKYQLQPEDYTLKQEVWGRMPLVLLLGDFLQLPPVPEKNSLLAEGTKAYEYEHRIAKCMVQQSDVVFFFKTSMRFSDPNLRHILDAMRTPGGKPIEDAAWQALEATQVNTCENGNPDAKLLAALDFKEGAYEWQTVSLTQQVVARLQAAQSKRILYYIPAVDVPEVECSKQLYRKMSAECNLTSTQKLMSILPIFLGMRVRLMKSLTPQLGPESEGEVVGIEFHPNEPSIIGKHGVRPSVSSSGFALLHLLPLCVYVKFDNCLDCPFPAKPCEQHQISGADASCTACKFFTGVFAIRPQKCQWKFHAEQASKHQKSFFINVSRWQVPVAPANQKTLHTLQGMTAQPGLKAHWSFPPNLPSKTKWLATYVMLSRPRSLQNLISFGLPERSLLEAGPPADLVECLDELFAGKEKETEIKIAKARASLGWPASK